jgi:hypothetical protein
MTRPRSESKRVPHHTPQGDAAQGRKGTRPRKRETLSLYPLSLEDALGAAVTTGPIAPEDRKPKKKK